MWLPYISLSMNRERFVAGMMLHGAQQRLASAQADLHRAREYGLTEETRRMHEWRVCMCLDRVWSEQVAAEKVGVVP